MLDGGVAFDNGGTRRACSTVETLDRLQPLLERFGITRVANITGLDRIGIPVAVAIRPASKSLVVSQGKGATLTDAKVSAIMESIELHHAERPHVPVRIASLHELRREGSAILDCAAMPRTLASGFDEQMAIAWAQGIDLTGGAPCWVPYGYVDVDDSLSALPVPIGIPVNSNGLASGNVRDEAILHALFELVERDAIALWHLADEEVRQARAVDLSTLDDPHCRVLVDQYDRANVDVHVFDLTSDIDLPVYQVFIRERGNGDRDAFSAEGSGCHRWRGIALSRALTEAAQCRLTHIAGAREDLVHDDYAATSERLAQIKRYLSLTGGPVRPFQPADKTDPGSAETFAETLSQTISALQAVGIEQVVAVSLAPEDLGIHVVRMLVPGLEGLVFEPGYVPGARARALLKAQRARA
ncbi:YcaO-like family protein [Sphingobium nicotianae]|nr:YcaO-like family protein [Sphingobium nicotianae]